MRSARLRLWGYSKGSKALYRGSPPAVKTRDALERAQQAMHARQQAEQDRQRRVLLRLLAKMRSWGLRFEDRVKGFCKRRLLVIYQTTFSSRQLIRASLHPKLAIVLSDNSVALAGGVFKFLAVHDLHCATGVLDELFLLQNTSCQAHGRSACP
jgi:hypothetical protein